MAWYRAIQFAWPAWDMGSMAVLAAKAAEAIVTAATRYDSTKLLWRRLDFFMSFLSITSTRHVLYRSVGVYERVMLAAQHKVVTTRTAGESQCCLDSVNGPRTILPGD